MRIQAIGTALALSGILMGTQFANAQYAPGQWVLSQFQGGAYYYPGVVIRQQGNMVTTRYDDGDVDTRPSNQVKRYNWRVGSRVECNYRRAGVWYRGRISGMQGDTGLYISYDDGDFENTVTGLCRSQ